MIIKMKLFFKSGGSGQPLGCGVAGSVGSWKIVDIHLPTGPATGLISSGMIFLVNLT
jgi:hypothetical protein